MQWWALALISCAAPGWFEAPPEVAGAECASWAPAPAVRREVAVSVALGRGVPVEQAVWHTRWAAAVWRQWGVRLFARGRWRRVSGAPIFAGTPEGSLQDVVAPLAGYLDGPPADVRVVVLPALAEPGSPAARWFDPLVGFTLVPEAVRGHDELAQALRAIGVSEQVVPTVFVGLDTLSALPRERSRFGLAHELGHALGLPHVAAPDNLMGPGFPRCLPELDAAQISTVGSPQ